MTNLILLLLTIPLSIALVQLIRILGVFLIILKLDYETTKRNRGVK